MQEQTSTSQIGIEWEKVVPVIGQTPGQDIEGYVVSMMEVNKAAGEEA